MMEEAIRFACGNVRVHGTLHRPRALDTPRSRTGILFMNAGLRSRRGPYRIYVRFARQLCREGYHVFRYDNPGTGDSPGRLVDLSAAKRELLDGAGSSRSAIAYFRKSAGLEQIGLVGLCGGAYSAVMANAGDPCTDFLVLASLPIEDMGDLTERSVTAVNTQAYLRKTLDWKRWRNLLTGKSKYRWVARSAVQLLRFKRPRPGINEALWQAFAEYLSSGRRMLCVYGKNDPFFPPFDGVYRKRLARLPGGEAAYDLHVVDEASHSFAQIRWQDELMATSIAWINRLVESRESGDSQWCASHGWEGQAAHAVPPEAGPSTDQNSP